MAVPLTQFVARLTESGLMTPAEIREFHVGLAPDKLAGDDAQKFARELVRRKKLTAYQAAAVYQNRMQGLVFGNYTVLDKLGQGGMGVVFKAEYRRMKRIVALKVMSKSAMKSPDAVKRFLREVEAAARLTHPNIVAAHDAGQAQGVHFLVTEYVDGTDLAALVKKYGPLPVDKAVSCILQAARGLAHAHGEGVIHRDIKPANLLLDRSGTVKVLDMGLARLDDTEGQADLTRTGTVMGTVDYMAPEQALDTKSATAKADVYSLGMSLWFLLTGEPAYGGESLMARLLAHRDNSIPSLSERRDDVPEALEAVFRTMVAKRPEERYPSMAEVVADLEACLAGGIVSAATSDGTWSASSPSAGSSTAGIDAELQLFLQAISPVAGATEARRNLESAGAAETLSARAGGNTRRSQAQSPVSSSFRELLARPPRLAAVLVAVVALAGIAVWSLSGMRSTPADATDAARNSKSGSGVKRSASNGKPDEPRSGWHGWPADAPAAAIAPFDARGAAKHQEEWAAYLQVPVEFKNSLGMEFRLIPPGEFKMGLTEKQHKDLAALLGNSQHRGDLALPQHPVRLTRPFYIGAYEVQYGEFVDLAKRMPGSVAREEWMTDSAPITRGATWFDALAFCNALSVREGRRPCYRIDDEDVQLLDDANGYRLPTEAEWEFACRAGTETVWYYGWDPHAHLKDRESGRRIHAECTRNPEQSNPFGMFGMYAGADEWCADGFVPYSVGLTTSDVVVNPAGPLMATRHVKRGGASWSGGGSDLNDINSTARNPQDPRSNSVWSGLGRVVLNITPAQGADGGKPAAAQGPPD